MWLTVLWFSYILVALSGLVVEFKRGLVTQPHASHALR